LNATRAAVEEGIVAGGGCALLYATLGLKNVKFTNRDQEVGIDIVRRALQQPARAIIDNAGMEGAVVVGRLLEEAKGDTLSRKGMDSSTGQIVDMVKTGIIDPTKVVRTALVDAAGVASLMTTTECMIVDIPKPEPAGGGMGGGGMGMGGGMGGMGF
jgi:chaperonin GroEL